MDISLKILEFGLEQRGYRCRSHIENGGLYKRIQLLPTAAEQLESDCVYVAALSSATGLSKEASVILCGDAADADEPDCNYIWIRAIDNVQTLMNLLLLIHHELNEQETRLLSLIAQNAGLTECVDVISGIMGNPVYIIDTSFKLLAISSQPYLPLVSMHFRRMIQHGYLPITTVVQLLEDERWSRDIERGEPSVMDMAPFYNPFINCKIKTKNKLQGHLFVVQLDRGLVPRDVEIISQLLKYIKLLIDREMPGMAVQGQYYEHFLHDVISGTITDKQMIREQLQPLHWSPDDLYCIMYCPLNTNSPYMMQMLMEDLAAQRDAKPVYFGTAIYCVFPVKNISEYRTVAERAGTVLKHYKLTAGLSTAFHGFYHLSKYGRQATLAYELGTKARDIGNVFPYSRYAVTHLLSLYEEKGPIECFFHKAVIDLEEFDMAHNSQYGNTLYVYLRCERSVTRAAEKLNVHKNTLLHRISKIEEITGLSFDDPDLRLHLLLSYEMKKRFRSKQ